MPVLLDPLSTNDIMRGKSANHSRLWKAQSKQEIGSDVIRFCPFGCREVHEFDARGYCCHLVGFSSGESEYYEPLKKKSLSANADIPIWVTDGSDPRPIMPGMHKERITSSYRIYSPDGRLEEKGSLALQSTAQPAKRTKGE